MSASKKRLGDADFMDGLVPGHVAPAPGASPLPAPHPTELQPTVEPAPATQEPGAAPAAVDPKLEAKPATDPPEPVVAPTAVPALKVRKVKFGIQMDPDVLERYRNASWALRVPVVGLFAEALLDKIKQIELLNNDGHPFPRRKGVLRRDVSTD
jgi:hypothetical protein